MLKRLMRTSIFLFLAFVINAAAFAYAPDFKGLGLSVNYPGFGLKYGFGGNILEFRYQTMSEKTDQYDETTNAGTFRYYRYVSEMLYVGGESGIFDYQDSMAGFKTTGILFGFYAGVEKFIGDNISFNIDMGPYTSSTMQGSFSAIISDITMNASLNFYFRSVLR